MTSSWSKEAHHSANDGNVCPSSHWSLRTCSVELHSSVHLWAKLVQYSPRISGFLKQFPTCFNICHIFFSVSFCHVCCFLSFSGLWRHPSCLRRSSIKMTPLGAVISSEQCSAWPVFAKWAFPAFTSTASISDVRK